MMNHAIKRAVYQLTENAKWGDLDTRDWSPRKESTSSTVNWILTREIKSGSVCLSVCLLLSIIIIKKNWRGNSIRDLKNNVHCANPLSWQWSASSLATTTWFRDQGSKSLHPRIPRPSLTRSIQSNSSPLLNGLLIAQGLEALRFVLSNLIRLIINNHNDMIRYIQCYI